MKMKNKNARDEDARREEFEIPINVLRVGRAALSGRERESIPESGMGSAPDSADTSIYRRIQARAPRYFAFLSNIYKSDDPWQTLGKYCLYILIFAIPWFFLPLTVSTVHINKSVLAALFLAVGLISFFATIIERRKIDYPASLVALALAALILIAGASAFFSKSPLMSLYGNLTRPDSFFSFMLFGVAFFLGFYFLREEDAPAIGKSFFLGVTIANLYGLLQILGKFILPWDFTRNAGFNPAGSLAGWGILMAANLLALILVSREKLKNSEKIFLVVSAAISAAGLIILNFQLLWLAMALVFAAVASVRFASHSPLKLPVLLALTTIFLTIASPYIPPLVETPLEIRPNLTETFSIARHTILSWRAFLGSGPSMFADDFALSQSPPGLTPLNLWNVKFVQGFNFPLTILSTMGILGLLGFLALVFIFFRSIPRLAKNNKAATIIIILSFLILELFFYPAFFTQLIFIFLGLGFLLSLSGERREVSFYELSTLKVFPTFIILLVLMGLALSGFYRIGQKYAAAVEYGNTQPSFASQNAPKSLEALNSILVLDGQTDEYWRAASQVSLTQARQALASSGGQVNDQIVNIIGGAIQAAQKATEINSANAVNWNNLGGVYENLVPAAARADEFSLKSYKKASELDPQNPELLTSIARVLFAQSNQIRSLDADSSRQKIDEAKNILQKSLSLKIDYFPARQLLAAIYLAEGEAEKTNQVLGEMAAFYPNDPVLAYQIGLFYYQNGREEQARTALERAVAIDSQYANARYILGLIYSKRGLKNQALEQFNKVLETNPDNPDVQKAINDLVK